MSLSGLFQKQIMSFSDFIFPEALMSLGDECFTDKGCERTCHHSSIGACRQVEIIRIKGTPTKDEMLCMNCNLAEFNFPKIPDHTWQKVFRSRCSDMQSALPSACAHACTRLSKLVSSDAPTNVCLVFIAGRHPTAWISLQT